MAHQVEVGAGVRAAQHHPGVLPHRDAGRPSLVAAPEGRGQRGQHDEQGEALDEDHVDEHVDRRRCPGRRRCRPGTGPTHSESGSATSMRAKSDSTPMARSATFSAPRPAGGPDWRGRRPRPGGRRRRGAPTSRHPGSPGSRVVDRIRIMSGRVRAITWAPAAAARSDASQLLLVDLLGGQAAEQVPVEGAVGGQRHVGHQLHPVVGDGADGRDELERGAGVAAQRAGQRDELLEGRPHATAPVGGRRPGGPRPARRRARGPRRPPTPRPGRPWRPAGPAVARSRVAASPITARRTVEWPTRNPALTARPRSTRSRYSANVDQSQGPPPRRASRGMPSTTAIICWM